MGGRRPWWPVASLLLSDGPSMVRSVLQLWTHRTISGTHGCSLPARWQGDSVPRHLPVSQQAQDVKGGFWDLPVTPALLCCPGHVPPPSRSGLSSSAQDKLSFTVLNTLFCEWRCTVECGNGKPWQGMSVSPLPLRPCVSSVPKWKATVCSQRHPVPPRPGPGAGWVSTTVPGGSEDIPVTRDASPRLGWWGRAALTPCAASGLHGSLRRCVSAQGAVVRKARNTVTSSTLWGTWWLSQ